MKRIIAIFTVAALFLSGCSNSSSSDSSEWTYNRVLDELEIAGTQYSDEISLEKLGADFTLSEYVDYDEQFQKCSSYLLYNGADFASVNIYGCTSVDDYMNGSIEYIDISVTTDTNYGYTAEENENLLKIAGIGLNSTKDELTSAMGDEPQFSSGYDWEGKYVESIGYGSEDYTSVTFTVVDNVVEQIIIALG